MNRNKLISNNAITFVLEILEKDKKKIVANKHVFT